MQNTMEGEGGWGGLAVGIRSLGEKNEELVKKNKKGKEKRRKIKSKNGKKGHKNSIIWVINSKK